MATPTPRMFASKRQLAEVGIHSRKKKTVEHQRPTALYSVGAEGTFDNRSDKIIYDADLPAIEELQYWWSCMRKVQFKTDAEALKKISEHGEHVLDELNHYRCSYCNMLHIGKRTKGAGNWKRGRELIKQWRKWGNKPTFQQLHAAYQQPAREGEKTWENREFLQNL